MRCEAKPTKKIANSDELGKQIQEQNEEYYKVYDYIEKNVSTLRY